MLFAWWQLKVVLLIIMINKSCTFDYHSANIVFFYGLSKLLTWKDSLFNNSYSLPLFHHQQPCGSCVKSGIGVNRKQLKENLSLWPMKANANREQNFPSLGNYARCSFAYSKKKRWVLCASHQLQSVILVSFFSLCLKRGYRKKGKIGLMYRCIGLHLEGSSFLRWTILSPFKSTVQFYRECERVMICSWDWGENTTNVVRLFPKCT